ncbi:MEDS domain-containing protein [Rossellomorea aquimaris]|uniref:MEDS domain-containing protein n=1 Tax=Rossellomorea aquimaris TaxID=189382 RepID=UPI0007D08466|nr:MEDS domain-containing protein [Rossellomorea aquimaris]
MKETFNHMLREKNCTHILYPYESQELYLMNVVAYVTDGIESGDSVVIIENERNLDLIFTQLNKQLSEEQLEKIEAVSNFEFYQSSGSYHPPAIFEELKKNIAPYLENDISFRTWTHVEWGSLENPTHIVEWFENETDIVMHKYNMDVVCAYDSEKMPADLKASLRNNHPHIMTDNDIIESNSYKPQEVK